MPNTLHSSIICLTLLGLVASPLSAQTNGDYYQNQMRDQARSFYQPMRSEPRRAYDEYDQFRQRQYQMPPRSYRQIEPRPRYVPDNLQRRYRRSYERFAQYQRNYDQPKWYPNYPPSPLGEIEPGFTSLPDARARTEPTRELPECPAEKSMVPVYDSDKDGITDQI